MPPIFSSEDKEKIKQELLTTGMSVIKEKGIKKTSIDEITKRVGIAKGTFYHFYPSKQRFIMDIITTYGNRQLEKFKKRIASIDTMELEELFMWYRSIRIDRDNPLFYMKPADGKWLRDNLPKEYIYNEQHDLDVARLLLSKVSNVRKDIDYAVVANMPKLIFLAMEHREELHQEVLNKNIEMMLTILKEYIEGGR